MAIKPKTQPDKLKMLFDRRREEVRVLREFMDAHAPLVNEYLLRKSVLEEIDAEIKHAVRDKYPPGSKRGIFHVYSDDSVNISVTVKYGSDQIDPEKLEERFPEVIQAHPDLIQTERKVNIGYLKTLAESGEVGEDVLALAQSGDYKTPAVRIKEKEQQTVVVED